MTVHRLRSRCVYHHHLYQESYKLVDQVGSRFTLGDLRSQIEIYLFILTTLIPVIYVCCPLSKMVRFKLAITSLFGPIHKI